MSDSPAVDRATYAALEEMADAEFARELVGTFLEEAPVMLKDLHAALADGDAERFRRSAHSLKSNGNTFGALKFAGLARDLEHEGLASIDHANPQMLDALDAEYARVAAELEVLRHG